MDTSVGRFGDLAPKVGTTEGLGVVGDLPPDDDFCYIAGGWLAKKAGGGEKGGGGAASIHSTLTRSP